MEKASGFPFGKSRGKVIYSDDVHLSSRRDNYSLTAIITKITASVFGCCFFVVILFTF